MARGHTRGQRGRRLGAPGFSHHLKHTQRGPRSWKPREGQPDSSLGGLGQCVSWCFIYEHIDPPLGHFHLVRNPFEITCFCSTCQGNERTASKQRQAWRMGERPEGSKICPRPLLPATWWFTAEVTNDVWIGRNSDEFRDVGQVDGRSKQCQNMKFNMHNMMEDHGRSSCQPMD